MNITKDSPDAKQELPNRIFFGRKWSSGVNPSKTKEE